MNNWYHTERGLVHRNEEFNFKGALKDLGFEENKNKEWIKEREREDSEIVIDDELVDDILNEIKESGFVVKHDNDLLVYDIGVNNPDLFFYLLSKGFIEPDLEDINKSTYKITEQGAEKIGYKKSEEIEEIKEIKLEDKLEAEYAFWEHYDFNPANEPLVESISKIRNEFEELLDKYNIKPRGTVVEIGPAIFPCVGNDNFNRRILIDPLMDKFLEKKPEIRNYFDNTTWYNGECASMLLAIGTVDMVVSRNSLDHVLDIDATMDWIVRVLKPNGYFVISWCHVFGSEIVEEGGLGENARDDCGHPYSFSETGLINLLDRYGLDTSKYEVFEREDKMTALRGVFKYRK